MSEANSLKLPEVNATRLEQEAADIESAAKTHMEKIRNSESTYAEISRNAENVANEAQNALDRAERQQQVKYLCLALI